MDISEPDLIPIINEALSFARLAPSPRNIQPWQFEPHTMGFTLRFGKPQSRRLADPFDRELIISCGVALGFAELYLRAVGAASDCSLFPLRAERKVIADVYVTGQTNQPDPQAAQLVAAQPHRKTNWGPFRDDRLHPSTLSELCGLAREPGIEIIPIPESHRAELLSLARLADERQLTKPAFQDELARWPTGRPSPSARDMTKSARDAAWGSARASHETGGHLFLLASHRDDDGDWVRTGRTLATWLLTAAALGLATSFLNQPLQLPDLRRRLRAIVGSPASPQILIRAGVSSHPPKLTARKTLAEVTSCT